jgi:hypothetical protein
MYIDYKKTTWERVHVPDNCGFSDAEIVKMVSETQRGNDWLWDELNDTPELEALYDTDSFMSPIENSGFSTIEAFDDNGYLLWTNALNT